MITIRHDSVIDIPQLNFLLKKYGKRVSNFDTSLIDDDIIKMSRKNDIAKYEVTRKNTNMIINNLEHMKKEINKRGKKGIEVWWHLEGNRIKSKPIEFISVRNYGINTVEYVERQEDAIVCIDYSEVMSVLALEIVYRDLGISFKSMENKLKDISIIGVNDIAKLKNEITLPDCEVMRSFRVEQTDYQSKHTNELVDYFGNNVGEDILYNKALQSSYNQAMSIITTSIISNANKLNLDMNIVSVLEDRIYLSNASSKLRECIETICLKVFGRLFEIVPEIVIY